MGIKVKTAITPTREENYPKWYHQVVKASNMAENSQVRGCMVIKPWGYALWENIMRQMDEKFKITGVQNAYFPLFIPLSLLEKEAKHVEGFAKECAVVTHHRLESRPGGGLFPAGKLTEPLVVRPTSETIIGDSFAKWIDSYRDLPVLINQWANIVRWEMRPRTFLRTSEFLWQEGHTAHANKEEAIERTRMMLDVYADFTRNHCAIPVIKGRKSPSEKFPGAVDTICIEAMMQDRKALQMGTSHFLGQNFAKSSGVKYQTAEENEEFVWTTSWGSSTRLIGGIIMTHADDDGMVMPPRVASSHVVLLPIIIKEDEKGKVIEFTQNLAEELREKYYHNRNIVVDIDIRDIGGARGWEWVKKGIPLRVEIGPRDIANDSVFLSRRDQHKKQSLNRVDFVNEITNILDDIQENLYNKALAYRDKNLVYIDRQNEFYQYFTPEKKRQIHGGFAMSHWCGKTSCEEIIKSDLSVTIRCIPFDNEKENGKCILCGKLSSERVIFAKSY